MTSRIGKKAEIALGAALRRKRESLGMTQMELGRAANQKQQQIDKFERGEFIPLPALEAMGDALGSRIPKQIIRRISFLRKLEKETAIEQDELTAIYETLFDED